MYIQWSTLRTKLKGPKIFFVVSVLRRKLFDRNLKEIIIQQVWGRFHRLVHSTKTQESLFVSSISWSETRLIDYYLFQIHCRFIIRFKSIKGIGRLKFWVVVKKLYLVKVSFSLVLVGTCPPFLHVSFTLWSEGEGRSLPANQRLRWCL